MNMKRTVSFLVSAIAVGVVHAGAPVRAHAFKNPAKMEMLRPGEVKPQGWLRDWCVTARNGYISRMDEIDQAFPRAWNRDFHPRGKYLDWGDPNKGAWCTEGGAYWFEGLVRLAWELDDAELKGGERTHHARHARLLRGDGRRTRAPRPYVVSRRSALLLLRQPDHASGGGLRHVALQRRRQARQGHRQLHRDETVSRKVARHALRPSRVLRPAADARGASSTASSATRACSRG